MNGAQALMRTLADAGVEVCFSNPGTSEMHFVAALDSEPRMRAVLALRRLAPPADVTRAGRETCGHPLHWLRSGRAGTCTRRRSMAGGHYVRYQLPSRAVRRPVASDIDRCPNVYRVRAHLE